MYAEIEAHRLVRALHAPDDVQFLEIKLQDFRGWQPSCTIPEANLQQYFAKKADERIRLRRYRAQTHRNQRKISAKPMRPKTFLSSWSSVSPKRASSCATHKESDKDVVAAARTAGFLFAISHSGLVVHLEELIGAESLSQRYAFLLHVLQQFPDLQTVVHDDSCHLHFMAQTQKSGSVLAEKASKLSFIVDAFHSAGHVGQWCKAHLMPDLPANKEKLAGFPTSIAEVVNASFSPLKHTIHHMGCFMAKFVLTELVDVHNMKVLSSVKVGRLKLKARFLFAWLPVNKHCVPLKLYTCDAIKAIAALQQDRDKKFSFFPLPPKQHKSARTVANRQSAEHSANANDLKSHFLHRHDVPYLLKPLREKRKLDFELFRGTHSYNTVRCFFLLAS